MPPKHFKNLHRENKGSQKQVRMEIKNRAESLALAISRAPQAIQRTTHNVANIYAEDIGRANFIKYLRLCKDSKITEILQTYDNLSESERNQVSFDHLCQQVDYPPEKLVGEAVQANILYRGRVIQGVLTEEAPAVIRAGMKKAATPDGLEDRRMAYQLLGLMPFDRAGDINIQNVMPKGTPRFEDAPDAAPSFMNGEVIDNEPDV